MKAENFTGIPVRGASQVNLSGLVQAGSHSLLLSAPGAKAGVSQSAMTLAAELVRSTGHKVLIVDASSSESGLTRQMDLETSRGLLNIDDETDIDLLCLEEKRKGFHVMPRGNATGQSSQKLYQSIEKVLTRLKNKFRFILIDSDPVYSNSNTVEICSLVDGVVLVLEAEKTRWQVAGAARKRLEQSGGTVVGCVCNNRRYYTPGWIYNKL